MRKISIAILSMLAIIFASTTLAADKNDSSTKQERNYLAAGNKLFKEGKYTEAELMYQKALVANPQSEIARFNIASSVLRRGKGADGKSDEKLTEEASKQLSKLATDARDKKIRELANYDLGNINYNAQKWKEAIEYYKQALRLNPNNDNARDNLRLAQKQQQQQQQNKDQNKDQDKDKDKDQNKDQDKKDQDKKDQDNKDQNKDQNKDKEDQQQQQQPKNGMSDKNADQILKAMENAENATRDRINQRSKEVNPTQRTHGNPW